MVRLLFVQGSAAPAPGDAILDVIGAGSEGDRRFDRIWRGGPYWNNALKRGVPRVSRRLAQGLSVKDSDESSS